MSDWIILNDKGNQEVVSDSSWFPENSYGFVYVITCKNNGKFYIGKKVLQNKLNKPLTKKEIKEWTKPGRVPKKKKVVKESNWKDYWGSNQNLKDDLEKYGEESFERRILFICATSKQLTYFETYYQIVYNVLCVNSYNDNIGGKFFRRDIQDLCDCFRTLTHPDSPAALKS